MHSTWLALFFFFGILHIASCSPSHPQITPPALLKRAIIDDSFEGWSSTLGTYTPIYCEPGYTYKNFGSIADCCPEVGSCRPITACSDRIIQLQGGSSLTCLWSSCATGLVYKTLGDASPVSMYGCYETPFRLYRNVNESDAAASSTYSSNSSSNATGPNSASSGSGTTSHIGLIVGAIIAALLFILVTIGLVVYICLLKRRQSGPTPPPRGTELQPVPVQPVPVQQYNNAAYTGTKFELPSNEGWAEMPTPTMEPQKLDTWSALSPQSYSSPQSYPSPVHQGWHEGKAVELPSPAYTQHQQYHELPAQ